MKFLVVALVTLNFTVKNESFEWRFVKFFCLIILVVKVFYDLEY